MGGAIDTCGHLSVGIDKSHINNESISIYPNPATN
jgi:hypothetical protein